VRCRCRLKKRLENAKVKMDKLVVTKDSREELKTVALGTSKINYLDPRITVAWCKRMDVPLERFFNKSLLGKFKWAMDVEPEFRF
jgi:DNA topoisomerase I